jgi:hypothetical protein
MGVYFYQLFRFSGKSVKKSRGTFSFWTFLKKGKMSIFENLGYFLAKTPEKSATTALCFGK